MKAWPRRCNAVGCVMRGGAGPLDVQKFRLHAPRTGASMRVLHKGGCGCASPYSRSCRRASAARIGRAEECLSVRVGKQPFNRTMRLDEGRLDDDVAEVLRDADVAFEQFLDH